MPIFISEEEFESCRHEPLMVAEKADQFIRDLHRQLETVRAEADAASIAAEHTCSVLEQRYAALSADCSKLQAENARLSASSERRIAELAEARAEKHNLHLKAISKDGEIERLTVEASELHKSKRQLLELVEQKDVEIGEKNGIIQSYLGKIIQLTDNAASKETWHQENEAELARCRSECSRLSQEKELITKHNEWLNEELTVKVNSLIELRRTHMEYEAEMGAKLSDFERQQNESSSKLRWSEERVTDLESRYKLLENELFSCKDSAAVNEDRFAAELATVTKLVELHKESSEEWSKKAGELEGVIKALETHLAQVENEYKEKLDKELLSKNELEKEISDLKEKLDKCELELEKTRKTDELYLMPLSSSQSYITADENQVEGVNMIVPSIPTGVSGTALAASLLRSGWSLAKMYEKYQETADALRHEMWERKHSEAILERVLHEIEEKAEFILDEREQHEKMVEAYGLMNQKLQNVLSVRESYESTIRSLKAELKRGERDYQNSQKEISDLQKQVTVLLKECRDIQLRCGVPLAPVDLTGSTFVGNQTSFPDQLLTFNDIHGLVEQNTQLRNRVRRLSDEVEFREAELRDEFQLQLQKVTDEAAVKVEAVVKRSEEQGQMIESLHSAVAMYKRLYDEERKSGSVIAVAAEPVTEGRNDLVRLFEGSQESAKKSQERLVERIRSLEDELNASRSDLSAIRLERDKMILEANFSKERLDSFMKEFDHQRNKMNEVLARNVELTQLIVDYQRKLREASESVLTSEEQSRKLSMEVSILEREKEIILNSEKRASDEVQSLSERVHRLQSTLDTIQSSDEVREDARRLEKIKVEDYAKKIEREWAEAKKELQEERDRVRKLTAEREKVLENSLSQVEETRKQLADAWQAVSAAESRAAVAEARSADLESTLKGQQKVGHERLSLSTANSDSSDVWKMKEELNKLKEEAQANKDYMLQYKEIAHTSEAALKNMESAHEQFKAESGKLKKTLEEEIHSLRERCAELEKEYMMKSQEASSAVTAKEEAISSSLADIQRLKNENLVKMSQILEMESQISSLKQSVEEEHQRWRNAQNNYERQVILLSETIQEMTKTSESLSLVQSELAKLQKVSDVQRAEYEKTKNSWEAEKLTLEHSKDVSEKKCREIDEQNKILHNRLEAMHIKLAELEHVSSSTSLKSGTSDVHGESDLQAVINYLRRSKEIAETEISLLKQEKLRLKSQLDAALKASETAQSLLRSERENSRKSMFSQEEFKSLQLQVREINLLRESNSQLREENKHNFEECQKLRENALKANSDAERLADVLREKEEENGLIRKEIDELKIEKAGLMEQINELRESSKKSVDLLVYEQLKEGLRLAEVKLREKDCDIESARTAISESQESIVQLQQELQRCKMDIEEREKKISEFQKLEESLRSDIDRQKRFSSHFKKRIDVIIKERDELAKEKQTLQTQIEETKSVKRVAGEGTSEQAVKEKEKEKDTRIHMLEKILEREREDLKKEREDNRKEKQRRQKMETTIVSSLRHVNQERKKLEEEIEKHRQSVSSVIESSVVGASQLPSQVALDEQATAYFQAFNHFEEIANSAISDKPRASPPPNLEPPSDVPTDASTITGHAAPVQPEKTVEQRERRFAVTRQTLDARKRKLVRPSLEQSEEQAADIDMSEAEGLQPATYQQEAQESQPTSSARKRVASSLTSEQRDDSSGQPEDSVKRPKASEAQQELEPLSPPPPEASDVAATLTEEALAVDSSEVVAEEGEEPGAVLEPKNEEAPAEELPSSTEELAGLAEAEEGELQPDASAEMEEGEMEALTPDLVTGEVVTATAVSAGEIPVTGDGPESGSSPLPSQSEEKMPEEPANATEERPDNDSKMVSDLSASAVVEKSLEVDAGSGVEGGGDGQSGKGVSEETEPAASRSSRTIILTERAKERALMRQAGMGIIPTPPRGRGRSPVSTFRRDVRGPRGGRSGRGQPSGEKEQG
ncbi:nuclear pore anchor [Wolffia australiana]